MLSSSELDLAGHAQMAREVDLTMEDGTPADDVISTFSARFVARYRQNVADTPPAVRLLDVVDVFTEDGDFVCRGVVESISGAYALVRAAVPQSHMPYRTRLEHSPSEPYALPHAAGALPPRERWPAAPLACRVGGRSPLVPSCYHLTSTYHRSAAAHCALCVPAALHSHSLYPQYHRGLLHVYGMIVA